MVIRKVEIPNNDIVAATGYQVYGEPDLSELLVNKTHM